MSLLDQYGRLVRRQELTRPQAEPGITGIRQAWSGTVASGLTPQRLASILRACDEGDIHDFMILAEEMEERDPHYASVLGSRKRAISGVAPRIEAVSESAADTRVAEAVEARIAKHDGFADLVEDLLDAVGKGFSVVEIDWQRSAETWWPRAFIWRDQRFFTFDRETGQELRLLDEAAPTDGLALQPFKFIQHRARLKSGLTFRSGIARVVAFSWMCKAYDLKDWMAFVETYGLPLRIGRYDGAATREDVEKLFTAVANIGTDAAAVIPRSMDIDFESTASTTGDKLFDNLARYLDEQISKAVLGQTMTSDDGSSQAQAKVHNDVRYDIAAADARAMEGTINRDLIRPFVDLNFGVQKSYPRLKLHITEPEDTDMLMKHVAALSAQGVQFRSSEVRARLGFSDPDADDEVIGAPMAEASNREQAKRKAVLDAMERGAVAALNNEEMAGDPFEALDEIEEEMLADWEEVLEPLAAPIREAVEAASSYEDLMDRLDRIEGGAKGRLIAALVKGTFKARSLGDVRDD